MDATCCIAFGRYPIRYFYIEARSKNRDFKIQRRGRQQERPKKTNRFNKQNNNFASASRFIVHFIFARLRRENA